jgi:hypothetical protein
VKKRQNLAICRRTKLIKYAIVIEKVSVISADQFVKLGAFSANAFGRATESSATGKTEWFNGLEAIASPQSIHQKIMAYTLGER